MTSDLPHIVQEAVKELTGQLPATPSELYDPARYMLNLGGKRIRPLICLMASDLFSGKHEEALPAAMALELFHNFTLVHDDIMDNAPLRRGQPTVHVKWNVSTAILSGDVMLVRAYEVLARSPKAAALLPVFSEMGREVCEGQQWDLNYEKLEKISIPQYYKMIGQKTAALVAASMKMGAICGGADEKNAGHLFDFGFNTGMAFQLLDDVLDVYGAEDKFGKLKGGDILANKKTFLLLKAMELCGLNPYKKEELAQWLSFKPSSEKEMAEKVEAVRSIYDFTGVRAMAEAEVNNFHQKALAAMQKVSATDDKKKELLDFTDLLLKREV